MIRFALKQSYHLYGQELSADISPLEAGIGFAVKLKKENDFIGKDALDRTKRTGSTTKIGWYRNDRSRYSSSWLYPVYIGDELIGEVTTGTQSPSLKRNIGLALIKTEFSVLGTEVEIEIRGKRLKASSSYNTFL